jgi:cysteine desulfurase
VPAIVGFGVAFGLVHASAPEREAEHARQLDLARRLREALTDVPGLTWTGDPRARLPGTVSAVIDGIEGGDLVAALDLEGIEISTGSACTSGSTEPSHVLLAMGIEPHVAHGSLRITTGPTTTSDEIDRAAAILPGIVARLRGGVPAPLVSA